MSTYENNNNNKGFLDFYDLDKNLLSIKRSIKLSCLETTSNYIVIGATTGSLYIFDRETNQFIQYLTFDDIRDPIIQMRFCPNERFLAIATSKMMVYVFEFNIKKRPKSMIKISSHKSTIKWLQWNCTDSTDILFSADENGNVFKTKIEIGTIKNVIGPDSEFLYQADSTVIQLDFDSINNQLIISSLTKSVVIDFKKGMASQIGKKLRDGPFGSCHFDSREGRVILSSRPGKRIWISESSNPSKVNQTLNFQSSLSSTEPKRLFLPERITVHVPSEKSVNFHRLHPFSECILSWSERSLFLIDIEGHKILQWHIDCLGIQDIVVDGISAFILYNDPEGNPKLARVDFNIDYYIDYLLNHNEYERSLMIIKKYKKYGLEQLSSLIESLKSKNVDQNVIDQFIEYFNTLEEEIRRQEEILRQNEEEERRRQEEERRKMEEERKAAEEAERLRKQEEVLFKKKEQEDVENQLNNVQDDNFKESLSNPTVKPIIKDNSSEKVDQITNENEEILPSTNQFVAPPVEVVVTQKSIRRKKKPIKKRVPQIESPKKISIPIQTKIPQEFNTLSQSPSNETINFNNEPIYSSSLPDISNLRSSSNNNIQKDSTLKLSSSLNDVKTRSQTPTQRSWVKAVKNEKAPVTNAIEDEIKRAIENDMLFRLQELIDSPYITPKLPMLLKLVVDKEKVTQLRNNINIERLIDLLQDSIGPQALVELLLSMDDEDVDFVMSKVKPTFLFDIIMKYRNYLERSNKVYDILENVDSYLWSPKSQVVSPQIRLIELQESQGNFKNIETNKEESSKKEKINISEAMPRYFGEQSIHWGLKISISKAICGQCKLPIRNSKEKVCIFGKCGHSYHVQCLDEDECSLCLEENFHSLLDDDDGDNIIQQ